MIEQYPGRNSLWVMDGASIHLDEYIIHFLRSCGTRVIFFPPYCPFYNPIEYVFGMIKAFCKSNYRQKGTEDLVLSEALLYYTNFSLSNIYKKCGYEWGCFDPVKNYKTRYQI